MNAEPRDRRPVVYLLIAQTLTRIGNVVYALAIPLHVLLTTGSATLTGVMAVASTAPVVIGGAFGGVLVDRFGYRRSSIVCDLVGGVTTLAVPLLYWTVGLPIWALFGFVFAAQLLDTPGETARTSLLPEASARAGISLERSSGWNGAADRGSRLIGAPLAGALLLVATPLTVIVVAAITSFLGAILVARFVSSDLEPAHAEAADASTGGYWKELAGGFRWVWTDPLMRALTLLIVVTNAFDTAKYSVLLPIYATEQLGDAATLGVLVGAHAAGALTSTLAFGAWGHRMPRRWTFSIGFVICGGPIYFLLAATPGLTWCIIGQAVAGLAAGGINPVLSTVLLERVPADMRARVGGVITAGCWAAMPIGGLAAGLLAQHLGLLPTLVGIGIGYVIATGTTLLPRPWRDLDRRPAAVAPVGSSAVAGGPGQ